MYAGQIVEMTDGHALQPPRHPYTYGLMGSLPNETAGATLEAIRFAPNLAHLPRLPFSHGANTMRPLPQERPALTEVEPGHLAAVTAWT